jgi:hypothetical protein
MANSFVLIAEPIASIGESAPVVTSIFGTYHFFDLDTMTQSRLLNALYVVANFMKTSRDAT